MGRPAVSRRPLTVSSQGVPLLRRAGPDREGAWLPRQSTPVCHGQHACAALRAVGLRVDDVDVDVPNGLP